MIINKSLVYILLNNITSIILGLSQHFLIKYNLRLNNFIYNFLITSIFYIFRNYILLFLTEYSIKNKKYISEKESSIPKENYPNEFNRYLIMNTLVESGFHTFYLNKILNSGISRSLFLDLITFIPLSFLYEIVYDFFYYLLHRSFHHKYIYKYFHKIHHKFKHPKAILLYYQHPFDWFLVTTVPTIISLYFIPNISHLQFDLILVYKTGVELFGHAGRHLYPLSTFTQFPWLVKYLQIGLLTEDHDLHHSINNCNYGKRFSLWDKVFNTYINGNDYYLKNSQN
jgi:sterol desaturase/sphingolipid hydroxylase (fatty acid hydroxylase superfamily)